MAKIAQVKRENQQDSAVAERSEEKLTRVVRETANARAGAANEAAQLAQSTTDLLAQRATEVAEDLHGATRKLAEEFPEFGRAFADLLGEQTRQGVDTLSAITRAVNWSDVTQAQTKLITDSFVRLSQFNARYGALLLRGMSAIPAARG